MNPLPLSFNSDSVVVRLYNYCHCVCFDKRRCHTKVVQAMKSVKFSFNKKKVRIVASWNFY